MEKLFFYLTKDGAWKLDFKDEIVAGSVITHAGEIVHARVKEQATPKAAANAGAAT
jgi:hypothetical protein